MMRQVVVDNRACDAHWEPCEKELSTGREQMFESYNRKLVVAILLSLMSGCHQSELTDKQVTRALRSCVIVHIAGRRFSGFYFEQHKELALIAVHQFVCKRSDEVEIEHQKSDDSWVRKDAQFLFRHHGDVVVLGTSADGFDAPLPLGKLVPRRVGTLVTAFGFRHDGNFNSPIKESDVYPLRGSARITKVGIGGAGTAMYIEPLEGHTLPDRCVIVANDGTIIATKLKYNYALLNELNLARRPNKLNSKVDVYLANQPANEVMFDVEFRDPLKRAQHVALRLAPVSEARLPNKAFALWERMHPATQIAMERVDTGITTFDRNVEWRGSIPTADLKPAGKVAEMYYQVHVEDVDGETYYSEPKKIRL